MATLYCTVRVTTRTEGAYLRYTLDADWRRSGNGTQIEAASGNIEFRVGAREKTLKAIAYKAGLADSPVAEAT